MSDLHFGLGTRTDGSWSPKEDFRWTSALSQFLDEVSNWGRGRVDLIILGDLLELWQPPEGVKCPGTGADAGCSVAEMVQIATAVIGAHSADLKVLSDFAVRGENRIYIVPGNHDATLLLPEVWGLLAAALNSDSGRVSLVSAGVWVSEDGRIVAEHGHQIGSDVNSYRAWPVITTTSDEVTYVERPWGERFVQDVFNTQEEEYEIIDNISPESVGVKYRIADRGLAKSAADVARFIAFNLFETSVGQKGAALGPNSAASNGSNASRWEISDARNTLKYRLFSETLQADDPLRVEIQASDARGEALKTELSSLAADTSKVSDADVAALCDKLALRKTAPKCGRVTAGAFIESQIFARPHVIRKHLLLRKVTYPRMMFYVYGHTHEYEEGWPSKIDGTRTVTVHNTGAFQRTIDETGFLSLVKKRGLPAATALRSLKLEDLPACYSFVRVKYDAEGTKSETLRWEMSDGKKGSIVKPGSSKCKV